MNVRVLIFGLAMLATSAYCTVVTALLKGTARLPCNAPQSLVMEPFNVVYWQKQVSPTHEVVLETRYGQEVPKDQTPKYVNRTRQDPSDLALHLDQVKLTDEGTFECIVFTQKPGESYTRKHKAEIQLKVLANFSRPELTQEPEGRLKNGTTVTLTCFSSEGYPAAQDVIWNVSSRNGSTELKGEVQKTQDNSTKLYNLTSIYTLNFTTNVNVSCTIHQAERGGPVSSRTVSLQEELMESHNNLTVIAVVVGLVIIVAVVAVIVILYRKGLFPCRAGTPENATNRPRNRRDKGEDREMQPLSNSASSNQEASEI